MDVSSSKYVYVNVLSCATRKVRDDYYEATSNQTRSSWARDASWCLQQLLLRIENLQTPKGIFIYRFRRTNFFSSFKTLCNQDWLFLLIERIAEISNKHSHAFLFYLFRSGCDIYSYLRNRSWQWYMNWNLTVVAWCSLRDLYQ